MEVPILVMQRLLCDVAFSLTDVLHAIPINASVVECCGPHLLSNDLDLCCEGAVVPHYATGDSQCCHHAREGRPRVNPLKPRQNGRHFADDIFKCIFLNENV